MHFAVGILKVVVADPGFSLMRLGVAEAGVGDLALPEKLVGVLMVRAGIGVRFRGNAVTEGNFKNLQQRLAVVGSFGKD